MDWLQKRRAFASIPGSVSFGELAHLVQDTTRFLEERFRKHGQIFKTRLLVRAVFMIGAEANQSIMVTRRHEFGFAAGYKKTNVNTLFANSMMVLDGEEHRRARGILSPAVGRLAIRECTDAAAKIWRDSLADAAETTVDVYQLAERTSFGVASNVLNGLQMGSESDVLRPYFQRLIDGMTAPTQKRIPFGKLDRALKARKELFELLTPKVEKARTERPYGLIGQLAHYSDEDGNPLPTDEIVGHLLLLFWAGYDTTASAVSWILQTLAQRPQWQERLREEMIRVLGDDVSQIEHSKDLVETNWFLHEIERMFPSVVFFPRAANEDIEYRGYLIPKDTPIFYSPYMSHRDPESFKRPNEFDPCRWDPSKPDYQAKISDLVGFGGGPRTCLGKAFAILQLKLMIHTVVTKYRIELEPNCEWKPMKIPVFHPVGSKIRIHRL
jgi:retinoid hydroxylase